MSKTKQFLMNRLGEQSTYNGLTLLLTLFGISISPEQTHAIAALGASIIGLISTFFPDSSKKKVAADLATTAPLLSTSHPVVQRVAAATRVQATASRSPESNSSSSTEPENQFL